MSITRGAILSNVRQGTIPIHIPHEGSGVCGLVTSPSTAPANISMTIVSKDVRTAAYSSDGTTFKARDCLEDSLDKMVPSSRQP